MMGVYIIREAKEVLNKIRKNKQEPALKKLIRSQPVNGVVVDSAIKAQEGKKY
jgi:hypothetical protein